MAMLRAASKPTMSATKRALVASICARSLRPASDADTYSTKAEKRARTVLRICWPANCGNTRPLTAPAQMMPITTSATRVSALRNAPSGCCQVGMPISAAV
ncbi:hypothetical protein QFZ94_003675 [Paraburkholderia sp. JPY465]